jgi:hypothetical protein
MHIIQNKQKIQLFKSRIEKEKHNLGIRNSTKNNQK